MSTESGEPKAPVDRLVMPPSELIDLVRFLCAMWSEIDKWAYRDTGDAIMFYPVVQGTRNQMDLRLIGQQKYNSQNVAKAIRWMIDHQYMLDRSA